MKPPIEISPRYTDHDAHGYKHGFGPCVCKDCQAIHAKPPRPHRPRRERLREVSWRKNEDPMAEARRLGVDKAVTNLKWSPARLEREMALSDSAKMFVGRVRSALQKAMQKEADTPRWLHKNSQHGYTSASYLRLNGEMEAVTADEQAIITEVAKQRSRQELDADREKRKQFSQPQRLSRAKAQADMRGVDISIHERGIERRLLDLERALDDRAA